ncbi:unnamed protein product, partial [Mesorhabditis spiculigera]
MFEQTLLYGQQGAQEAIQFEHDPEIHLQLGTSGWSESMPEDDLQYEKMTRAWPRHCLGQIPSAEIDDVTKILALNPRYNKNAYPTQHIDRPTEVKVQMYVEGMSSFRAQSMDFQIDIYLQEMWIDERLRHNNTKRILIKDPKLFGLIWHPDLYFANARTASFHEVTMPNFLVWIYPNGTVWYDARVSGAILCAQNLAKYPLDRQMCYLRILSYAYDNEQLVISWNGEVPIDVNKKNQMPDMKLIKTEFRIRNDTYATGVWSCALAEFYVDREIMHHIIQSYIPTTLIVIISWFSFWLDVEAVPGRVSLSITTLLTLATQSSAARMALPQASYVKAIDVWMGACMAFVFSAMIEFTVVNYCTRRKPHRGGTGGRGAGQEVRGLTQQIHDLVREYRQQREQQDKLQSSAVYECSSLVNGDGQTQSVLNKRQMRGGDPSTATDTPQPYFFQRNIIPSTRRKKIEERINRVEENRKYAQMIDRRSRVYFPLAFIIFNAIYWLYYLMLAPDHIDDLEE